MIFSNLFSRCNSRHLNNISSKNKDFVHAKNNKGITLVALVVTIIVLLILAGVTIMTLFGDNGLINMADKARRETENSQANAIAGLGSLTNEMNSILNGSGTGGGTGTGTGGDTEGGGSGGGDGTGISASAIATATNKNAYYGKKVNYTVTDTTVQQALEGQTTLYSEGVTWQLFYADSNNIYLIASDYVPVSTLPQPIGADGTKGTKPANGNTNYPLAAQFTNVLSSYAGSARITNTKLQALNSKYHKYLTDNSTSSKNKNMKAVAYMMDTEAWSSFKGTGAEYVIGGPTVEMLMKSYNEYKGLTGSSEYQTRVTSTTGYEISKDGGANWETYYIGMLSANPANNMYVKTTYSNRANAYWLASPSAYLSDFVMNVSYHGPVGRNGYNEDALGFRPVVSLSSEVLLKPVYDTDGETILYFDI